MSKNVKKICQKKNKILISGGKTMISAEISENLSKQIGPGQNLVEIFILFGPAIQKGMA